MGSKGTNHNHYILLGLLHQENCHLANSREGKDHESLSELDDRLNWRQWLQNHQ